MSLTNKFIWSDFLLKFTLTICVFSFFVFVGCMKQLPVDPLTPEERAWLSEHDGKIRLAHDPNARPIDYLDEQGVFKGLAADYVHLIEKRLNFKFDILHIATWDDVVKKAEAKEVDVVCTFTKNEQREKWMLFTEPYIMIPIVILTRDDNNDTLTLDKMNGMKVTFTKGWIVEDYLGQKYSHLDMVPAIDPDAALNNLITKKADAWVTALTVASNKIEENRVSNIRIAGQTDFSFKLAMASRKDWPILNNILKKGLALISEDERTDIFNKWIHVKQPHLYESRIFWISVFIIIGLALLPVVIIYSWNKSLKRKVKEKTEKLRIELKERKQAEEMLQESEERFRAIAMNTPDHILIQDKDLRYLYVVNPQLGLTEKDMIGKTDFDFLSQDDAANLTQIKKRVLENGNPEFVNVPLISSKGDIQFFEGSYIPRCDQEGKTNGLIGYFRNVTERVKGEEALRKSETKYRSMMESITDQLYICSPQFTIEYMNPAMIKRLGRDATGETCHNALHGLDHRCDWCVFDKVEKGESVETTIVSPLDSRTYRITNMPVQNQNGTVSKMSIFRDITDYLTAVADKDKAMTQLLQSQKMESIGTLAGGIAHDFNNILYPIIGFAEISLEDLPEVHPIKENLEDILQGAKRARDLVKQILAFSSQREEEQKPLLLAPLIQETLKLLRSTIPSNVNIQQELYDTQDCVLASPIEMHEIVMNLCTNAYHAMEKIGGTLRISLNKAQPGPELNLPHGDYCCLSISDTGMGIPPEIINHIFDPYFTTKELGKGSGLGLSVVHGIIKKYHGAITVESKPGKGTIFNIYLPITSAIKKPDETSDDKPSLDGNEKILFVDDEVAIVKLGVRLLERLGYKMTGKNSSIEALALFKSAPDDFDLVITDMAMPEMVGTEFAKKLMEIRSDIPIIICTGFSEQVDSETAQSLGIREYIHKPILSVDLYSKVRQVLDQTLKG